MDQEKIGNFIAQCRKEQNYTQEQLAELLGVSSRTISKWETGRGLPNLSLFEPLCECLNISLDELFSGEHIEKETAEIHERNLKELLSYSGEKIKNKNHMLGCILLGCGALVTHTAISVLPLDSSWSSIYALVGVIIALVGFSRFTLNVEPLKRVILNFLFFILTSGLLLGLDTLNVTMNQVPPRFATQIVTQDQRFQYQTPFFNVFKINANTENEYIVIDKEKEYTIDTVPFSPFNRNKSGIDSIKQFQNAYVGNNSNTSQLIEHLPLSDLGYVFAITEDPGIIVNYHMTDWIMEKSYLEKALVYNACSIFLLIDNVETVTFNFVGQGYQFTKEKCEQMIPHFKDITIDTFNELVEVKINDAEFISKIMEEMM